MIAYVDTIRDFLDNVKTKWLTMLRWRIHKPVPKTSRKKVLWTENAKSRAYDQMHTLIREIIRANFCRDALEIQMFPSEVYWKKMESLKTLERLYPELRLDHSPTRISWFSEVMARKAFGADEWETIKRTLWLLKEGNGLKDIPPNIILPKKGLQ
jgi:hypothetical protein